MIDDIDRRILTALQNDASLSVDALAEAIGLSRNACWRRLKRLNDEGVILRRVALLDPEAVNAGLMVFIAIRTNRHDPEWLEAFAKAVRDAPEIQGAYRVTGDVDYLLRARVPDMKAYDALYQRLIRKVPLSDVSASFVMEAICDSPALPLDYI